MSKVTYLFGAGASCLCLPLVDEIPQSLLDFDKLLRENIPNESKHHDTYYKMLQDLEVLIQNAKTHSSIDTYAKKLFIIHQGSNSPVLIKLKFLLSFCFVYEQIRYPPDYRYDTFFASILKDSAISFNGNIRIVSWNYDYQFEKAYNLYTGEKSLLETQKQLPVIPNEDYNGSPIDKFSIFKINGTTTFDDRNPVDLTNFFNDLSFGAQYHKDKLPGGIRRKPDVLDKATCQILVTDFLEKYSRAFLTTPTIFPLLNFSWELYGNGNTNTVLNGALSSINGSDTLVIIGYSFPFFNRNIDQMIISCFTTNRKIYIQDPKFEEVLSNLKSIAPGASRNLVQVKNMDQFYLPGEL